MTKFKMDGVGEDMSKRGIKGSSLGMMEWEFEALTGL